LTLSKQKRERDREKEIRATDVQHRPSHEKPGQALWQDMIVPSMKK